jgi:Bacteriophage tail assembly protein
LLALSALAPPPDMKPSEWAEKSVYIPVGNAIPGLIRFDNAPYQREPLDMTVNPECSRITLQWGGQVGKTMVALCAQAFRIAQEPTSQIMMQPSEGDLNTWLQTKFNPLIEANPELEAKIATPRARKGVNNTRMKSYPGGHIMFSWSGSPKTMRGRSAPFIVCDETDGYDRTNEGHPVSLLWQRAATFGDQRLLLEISTPLIKGTSWIESSFEQGDQRRFHVACPKCGHVQPLRWSQVKWEKDDDGNHLPETAYYQCDGHDPETGELCDARWSDSDRVQAIRIAEELGHGWIAAKPFKGHASYHLSELYSTFRRLSDIVQSFLEKKAANDVQTFVNVSLAETWEEEAESLEVDDLIGRVEKFPAQVPAGVGVLTAGVDMQEDRLEVEVVGWGLGEESWSVDHEIIWGDPTKPEVWAELWEYLDRTFTHESGAEMKIAATCVDTGGSGGLTQAAYEQLRGKQRRKIFAIKGKGGWNRPIVSAPAKARSGRKSRPVTLFTVGTDEAKLYVMRCLKVTSGPRTCHFPDDRPPEYFHQLTAERLVTKMVRGFPFREWHKTRERNEVLDCRVYAYAALKIENPNMRHRLARLQPLDDETGHQEELVPGEPPEEEEDQPRKTRRRRARRPRGRGRGRSGDGW